MKRINSVGKWVTPMLVLLISIIIIFYTSTITYKNIGTNELFATVDAITRGYKIKTDYCIRSIVYCWLFSSTRDIR